MKLILLAALCAGAAHANLFAAEEYEFMFSSFQTQHGYDFQEGTEYTHRLGVFSDNVDRIHLNNQDSASTHVEAMNEFGHMTWGEFKQHVGLTGESYPNMRSGVPAEYTAEAVRASADAGATVDWRTKGAVTPVKNQGQCGSCWAFSTTGSTEGAHFLAGNKLTSFSEQQLVDCAGGKWGNQGCNGGAMDQAFKYIEANGGLDTEDTYKYTGKTGLTCKAAGGTEVKDVISGFQDVQVADEAALKTAATQQPVSVAIQANQMGFQFYKSGVFTSKCGTQLDHGVLVVGYGTQSSNDDAQVDFASPLHRKLFAPKPKTKGGAYWLVKNSWGATWGDAGYIMLGRASGSTTYNGGKGQCGVAMNASFPKTSAAALKASTKTHYGDPAKGCESDEISGKISGMTGDFCAPKCDSSGSCPTDVPSGTTAAPQCILQTSGGDKYCALVCKGMGTGTCPQTANCETVQFIMGLCAYPAANQSIRGSGQMTEFFALE